MYSIYIFCTFRANPCLKCQTKPKYLSLCLMETTDVQRPADIISVLTGAASGLVCKRFRVKLFSSFWVCVCMMRAFNETCWCVSCILEHLLTPNALHETV